MFVIPEISAAFYATFSIILFPDDTIFIVIIYSDSRIHRQFFGDKDSRRWIVSRFRDKSAGSQRPTYSNRQIKDG